VEVLAQILGIAAFVADQRTDKLRLAEKNSIFIAIFN